MYNHIYTCNIYNIYSRNINISISVNINTYNMQTHGCTSVLT